MESAVESANTMAQALKQAMRALGGTQSKQAIGRWIEGRYPGRWKPGTLVGHLAGCSVNNPTGIKHHRSFLRFLYDRGNGEYELYDSGKHGAFDENGYSAGQEPLSTGLCEEIQEVIEESAAREFAYESHLRDYLARNLSQLEDGLSLWTEEGTSSVEFAVSGRRIDILARDKNGVPVIIELKVSRGHDRTIGQALYYRAKLKQMLEAPCVRIMLVAAEMSEELRMACREVSDVLLFEYSLSMQVHRVSEGS